MISAQDQVFFVGQKAFIQNDKGELLILFDENIGIDLPGGKVQEGETDLIEALKREVKEETNLDIIPKRVFHTWLYQYPVEAARDKRSNGMLYLVGYMCKKVNGIPELSIEHTGYQWITKSDLDSLEEKGGHYLAVKRFFESLEA